MTGASSMHQEVMGNQAIAGAAGDSILDLLARRRSPYAFSSYPVEPQDLRKLFEAARWSPSSYNEQPWSFVVVTRDEPEGHNRMLSILVEANQKWARHAPVLALAVARLNFAQNDRPNRHALYDLGQAIAHLTVQGTALGLAVHQMGGFDIEQARQRFLLPAGYEPVAVIAIGYPGDPEALPEALRRRETAPRIRRPLEGFVFNGIWGEPLPLARQGAPGRRIS